jgi:hypothetical protein
MLSDWRTKLQGAFMGGPRRRAKRRKKPFFAERRPTIELLESRRLLAVDWGDAPDLGPGVGPGDYNTLAADNGPSHTIVDGLRMGANVDGGDGTLRQFLRSHDRIPTYSSVQALVAGVTRGTQRGGPHADASRKAFPIARLIRLQGQVSGATD